jgi:hypothetical protein
MRRAGPAAQELSASCQQSPFGSDGATHRPSHHPAPAVRQLRRSTIRRHDARHPSAARVRPPSHAKDAATNRRDVHRPSARPNRPSQPSGRRTQLVPLSIRPQNRAAALSAIRPHDPTSALSHPAEHRTPPPPSSPQPQQPPPQHPPPPPGAGEPAPDAPGPALPPTFTATAEISLTVSSCPAGQRAGSLASAIGREISKVSPHERQRYS